MAKAVPEIINLLWRGQIPLKAEENLENEAVEEKEDQEAFLLGRYAVSADVSFEVFEQEVEFRESEQLADHGVDMRERDLDLCERGVFWGFGDVLREEQVGVDDSAEIGEQGGVHCEQFPSGVDEVSALDVQVVAADEGVALVADELWNYFGFWG